jgi:hypothetical protein
MVRLKQCECAMADGLLDEAFEIARQPEVRGHRRGQQLIEKLVSQLVERGREHLAAARLTQAATDSEKAAQLGGNLSEVAQLRAAIANAMHGRDRAKEQVEKVLGTARRNFEAGQVTVAEHVLDAIDGPNSRAEAFRQDIAGRRLSIEAAGKKAVEALASGHWEAAIDFLSPLAEGCAQDAGLRKICDEIQAHLVGQISETFEAGRLNVACSLVAGLDRLPIRSVEAENLRMKLQQCRAALEAIENGKPQDAEEILRRVGSLWPKARWLSEAAEQVGQIAKTLSAIRSGPLSLVTIVAARNDDRPVRRPPLAAIPKPIAPTPAVSARALCLHVDGIGSYQIFTEPVVTLGPIGSSRAVDIPLMLDAGLPRVTVTRSDEDCFLKAERPVLINEQPVNSKLLANGDRIGLGTRCRITFRRPVAASGSAVLELSGTRLPSSTIRNILLMNREIIVGPGTSSHVRADDLVAPLVLQMRGDGMFCRATSPITVDGRVVGQAAEIPVGASVSVGSIRFVIARELRT